MLWILSSTSAENKTSFFFSFFFLEPTELITRLKHGCETFSLLHIFFGCHFPHWLLCLMVIASLSHQIIQIQPTWQPRPPADIHTQSAHICVVSFRQKEAAKAWKLTLTQQNEIMNITWHYLSKICVRSVLEVFYFIVLQWTTSRTISPQREWWSTSFYFLISLSIYVLDHNVAFLFTPNNAVLTNMLLKKRKTSFTV